MDKYIMPVAILAGLLYLANKHAALAKYRRPGPGASSKVAVEMFPRDPIAPETSTDEIAPRVSQSVTGALGWGIPGLAPKQVNPWANPDFF